MGWKQTIINAKFLISTPNPTQHPFDTLEEADEWLAVNGHRTKKYRQRPPVEPTYEKMFLVRMTRAQLKKWLKQKQ